MLEYKKYIKGNPEAVLMVEFIDTEKSVYEKKIKDLEYLVLNQTKKRIFFLFRFVRTKRSF